MRRPNRRQGLRRARTNIEYHYDLGNDLFRLMLDETMTYSCTMFAHPDEERADAQRRKLRRVCDRLALTPDDHVVEIDCGLGSFALTAAGEYGARVTGLTLSPAQAELARERVCACARPGSTTASASSRRTTACIRAHTRSSRRSR
jgi:cyclopropane-fatty-acyl-phospholipid synthase